MSFTDGIKGEDPPTTKHHQMSGARTLALCHRMTRWKLEWWANSADMGAKGWLPHLF